MLWRGSEEFGNLVSSSTLGSKYPDLEAPAASALIQHALILRFFSDFMFHES